MKNIIILAHKFLPQPDDDLVLYLNKKNYENVVHIYHSFSDASDRKSYCRWYRYGKLFKQMETHDFKNFPEPIIYLKEFYFTLIWILQTKFVWDKFIGMDGLCTNFGLFLKTLKKVKLVIYWAIDFVPEKRFKQKYANRIYHKINTSGYTNADEIWDISPRMATARNNFLHIDESVYKKRKVVPYGVWLERIKKYTYQNCEQNTLVFMGHLLEKQGVQLVLRAMPLLIKNKPHLSFKIIGTGQYEETLRKLAKDLNVDKHCKFMGKIPDTRAMEEEIAKSAVAIAPYIKSLDTWTFYADPGKIKTYLACGVPVVLTDIPWNANEITKKQCGLISPEDEREIARKVLKLMDAKTNQQFRKSAIQYSKSYCYQNIFGALNI